MASSTSHESIGDASLYILLWMILPNSLTGFLQSTYYRFKYPSMSVAPQPGSSKYKRHNKICYIIVVGSYLAFCAFQVVWMLPPNYYTEFSLPTGASLKEIRSRFRKFSLQYHPDKNPSPEAESTFIRLKQIYETITHPVTREAYVKFGASKLESCSHCIIFKDYIYGVTTETIATYIASGIILFLLVLFNTGTFSQYFRVVGYFLMMALEASMLVLPYDPIYWFFPQMTVAEKLTILHQWGIYVFMALNHFGPLFSESDDIDEKTISQALSNLSSTTLSIERDVKKCLKAEMSSFASDSERFILLRQQMEKIAVAERLSQRQPESPPLKRTHHPKRE